MTKRRWRKRMIALIVIPLAMLAWVGITLLTLDNLCYSSSATTAEDGTGTQVLLSGVCGG